MAYAFVLLAALGLFLWASPARTAIAERIQQSIGITQDIASSSSDSLRAQAGNLAESLRLKSMELLRQQLHGTVDELVK